MNRIEAKFSLRVNVRVERAAVRQCQAPRALTFPERPRRPGAKHFTDRSNALLAGLAEFLAKHAAQGALERLVGAPHVFAQGSIDQGLVVAAASVMHAALEPGDDVIVQADGNALLALGNGHHGSALGVWQSRIPFASVFLVVAAFCPAGTS